MGDNICLVLGEKGSVLEHGLRMRDTKVKPSLFSQLARGLLES